MVRFFLICLGGAIGTAARYGISVGSRALQGSGFPIGTLLVNVVGSFLLGVILAVGKNTAILSDTTRLVLGTGVMGGFTTYSSFTHETIQLAHERSLCFAALNLVSTLLGGFAAGLLGLAFGKRITGG